LRKYSEFLVSKRSLTVQYMRFLFLIQGRTTDDQPGYHDGCLRLLQENRISAYDYFCYYDGSDNLTGKGWSEQWSRLERKAKDFSPDLVLLQFFHGPMDNVSGLMARLRVLPSGPTIASSCGDPFAPGLLDHGFPRSFIESSSLADMSFFSQMGRSAKAAEKWGARNLLLWPHGNCQKRFPNDFDAVTWKPEFDVVFVGNHTSVRNPFSSLGRGSKKRAALVDALTRRYGKRLGLFGRGWNGNPAWQGPIPYHDQVKAFRRGRVVFGGYPHASDDYYLSDRPFIAMGSGIPLIDYRVPKVDELFLEERDWYLFSDSNELMAQCDKVLKSDCAEVMRKAEKAAALVHQKHTQYHRMKFAIETMTALRMARLQKREFHVPEIEFLLPGPSGRDAIRNIRG